MNINKKWFMCLMGMHEWTCAAEQGIPPTKEQLIYLPEGFYDYATMYCKNCGKRSKLNMK